MHWRVQEPCTGVYKSHALACRRTPPARPAASPPARPAASPRQARTPQRGRTMGVEVVADESNSLGLGVDLVAELADTRREVDPPPLRADPGPPPAGAFTGRPIASRPERLEGHQHAARALPDVLVVPLGLGARPNRQRLANLRVEHARPLVEADHGPGRVVGAGPRRRARRRPRARAPSPPRTQPRCPAAVPTPSRARA